MENGRRIESPVITKQQARERLVKFIYSNFGTTIRGTTDKLVAEVLELSPAYVPESLMQKCLDNLAKHPNGVGPFLNFVSRFAERKNLLVEIVVICTRIPDEAALQLFEKFSQPEYSIRLKNIGSTRDTVKLTAIIASIAARSAKNSNRILLAFAEPVNQRRLELMLSGLPKSIDVGLMFSELFAAYNRSLENLKKALLELRNREEMKENTWIASGIKILMAEILGDDKIKKLDINPEEPIEGGSLK